MTISLVAPVLLLAIALAAAAWAAFVGPDRLRQRALVNLHRGQASGREEDDEEQPSRLAEALRRVTPVPFVRLLDRLYVRAGRPADWPVDRLLVLKPLMAAIVGFSNLYLISLDSRPLFVLVAVVATSVAYFLPELLLYSRGIERSERITLELADTLDQMTIAVEAGLGFDAAMARSGDNGTGPLAEELVRTLQDIRMGQGRRQAFEGLAARTDVVDLRRFVRAIIQADKHGIAIADVLRTQANEMRLKRRQRAEEKAMQIPVKVIFPLMVCILPVLFIVLMGPAAMDIMDAFSS